MIQPSKLLRSSTLQKIVSLRLLFQIEDRFSLPIKYKISTNIFETFPLLQGYFFARIGEDLSTF